MAQRHQLLLLVPRAARGEAAARSSPSGTSAARWTTRSTRRRTGDAARAPRSRAGARSWRACFDGGTPRDAAGARAAAADRARSTCRAPPFEALIEGVEMDLAPRRYETFDDLYEYCIRVASAVGLMCVEIFGCRDPASRQYAIDLGVALQLTNILRDVPRRSRARPRLHSARRPRALRLPRGRSRRARRATPGTASVAGGASSCSRSRRSARATTTAAPTRALPRARRAPARRRARSWARSTARSSTASSAATTTSSAESIRVPRPRRALIAAADVGADDAALPGVGRCR